MGHRRTGQGQCHAANTCTRKKELGPLAMLLQNCLRNEKQLQASQSCEQDLPF